jgi:hypothetical protein
MLCVTPEWMTERRDAAMERGSHKSPSEYQDFLEVEMTDVVKKGYWVVLPYNLVRDHPNLRAAGVLPQRDRRPRPIVDYSDSGVNPEALCSRRSNAIRWGTGATLGQDTSRRPGSETGLHVKK